MYWKDTKNNAFGYLHLLWGSKSEDSCRNTSKKIICQKGSRQLAKISSIGLNIFYWIFCQRDWAQVLKLNTPSPSISSCNSDAIKRSLNMTSTLSASQDWAIVGFFQIDSKMFFKLLFMRYKCTCFGNNFEIFSATCNWNW